MGHRHLGQVSSMIEHGLSYLMPTRYLNQDLSPDEIHLLVGSWSDGVPAMELPVDEEAQSGLPPPISMRTTSGISASHQPTTRLGPFCRAAEAGHLLGQVLDLIAQSSYSREMDFEKARALDHAMQSFAMVLVQQAINGWEECCAAIGLCLRFVSMTWLEILLTSQCHGIAPRKDLELD